MTFESIKPSFEPAPIINRNNREVIDLDLSKSNPELQKSGIDIYIDQQLNQFESVGIGGYLEERRLYEVSENFLEETYRSVHLGIDIWDEATSEIYAPIEGIVVGNADNTGVGDYGPTLILKHEMNDVTFHTLYGHLSRKSLLQSPLGTTIKKGQTFCWLGNHQENGNWPSHLHFQIIIDLPENCHDYPGVCLKEEIEYYKKNCPNPSCLISF